MNGRKGKYNGEALKTFEKVIDGRTNYVTDVLHKNEKYNIFWCINKAGYLHILRPCKVKIDGEFLHYSIEDFILTKDNILKSKGHSGNYKNIEAVIDELENKTLLF